MNECVQKLKIKKAAPVCIAKQTHGVHIFKFTLMHAQKCSNLHKMQTPNESVFGILLASQHELVVKFNP